MKDIVFSERFSRSIGVQLPLVNRGLLNCFIVDDPYVKFKKWRARVQLKRIVNSVEFAHFKTSFLSTQMVAINWNKSKKQKSKFTPEVKIKSI